MTKHGAVKAYFEPKIHELTKDVLHFNYSPESLDSFGLLTNYAEQAVKRFINGNVRKAYGFTIEVVKEYSTSGNDLNLECMNFVQGFMDWIEEQNEQKNYPDFGERCEVEKIELLQNMPNFAGVTVQEGLARHMVQGRILDMEMEKGHLGKEMGR